MLSDEISRLYKKFRLVHYRDLFGRIREKEGQLSATEAFAADVVYLLGQPTIGQFAETLGISQPNATYKVNNLEAKGYIRRMSAPEDRRSCRVAVGERFHSYYDTGCDFIHAAVKKLQGEYSPEQLAGFEVMLRSLCRALDEEDTAD